MNDDFDDLDELERELGGTVRVALRRVAKTVADDHQTSGSGHGSSAGAVFLTVDVENSTESRQPHHRVHLIAAGILVAASVAGIALVGTRDGGTAPAVAPNQAVAEDAAPVPLTEHVLTDVDSVEVTLSLPPGWVGDDWAVTDGMDGTNEAFVSVWDVTHVYADPCQWEGTLEEVGPTVDDLATALEQQPMRNATVSDVEVDGFSGRLVTMSVPDDMAYDASAPTSYGFTDCDRGQFMTWNNPAGNDGRWQQGLGQRDDVYILDVNGTRVVLNVAYYPSLQQPQMAELESIVQSMRIRSVYVLSPIVLHPMALAFTAPAGWGVVDDFAVTRERDGGGAFISVWDVTHVYSDPCQWEGTLEEVGPTVDDLAAALEQQPMRNATVSDVEVDGFSGRLVTMSVPDDMAYDESRTSSDGFVDCDGGEFRTWNSPAGNDVRGQQGPGQIDDVYILDVDGTRVVVNAAYWPDFPQADRDEIESIVRSVRITPPETSATSATAGSAPGD